MPKIAALELLLQAYREEIDWLMARAKQHETDQPSVAADYIHRAIISKPSLTHMRG
jgi:hypothetical protein